MLKLIPNVLTLFRFVLICPFLLAFYRNDYLHAFYIFLLAGFTDGLDGWLARYCSWQTPLGSCLDPFADKLLVAASFISLALIHQLPWWLVILVFMRDFTISTGVLAWYYFIQKEMDFEPTYLSKINTVLQLGLVTLCLFELAFSPFNYPLRTFLIDLTAFTTAVTYIHYVWTWGKKACTKHHLNQ